MSFTALCVGLQSTACGNNANGHTTWFCGIKADRHMVLGGKKIQILHGDDQEINVALKFSPA